MKAVLVLLLFSGCAFKMTGPDEMRGKNFAIIQVENRKIKISLPEDSREVRQGKLYAGDRTIRAYWTQGWNRSMYLFRLNAVAGHAYVVRNEVVQTQWRKGANLWVEDLNTKAPVGEILESFMEPTTERTPPYDSSTFFSWPIPRNEGWFVIERSVDRLQLDKDGPDKDKYSIFIAAYGMPGYKEGSDLAEDLKQAHENYKPVDQFETLPRTYDVEPYKVKGVACARVHQTGDAWVHLAVTYGYTPEGPTDRETFRYICIIPGTRDHVVSLDYSHEAAPGQHDATLEAKSEAYFSRLKF